MSTNEKHFSNTEKSLTLIAEILFPYIEKEVVMLNLGKDFPALRIINVFSGEMAAPAIKMLRMNSISNVRVTANMTNLFWPLDLTVNGSAKACIKRRLTESYSPSVSQQLDEGEVFDNIKVELKLSIFKLLHSGWIKDYYLTSEEGGKVISNGSEAAFITDAIEKGSKSLVPLNPFYEVDPLTNEVN